MKERSSSFSSDEALKFAQTLAFPRQVGSIGELAAARLIASRFTELGYEVEQQEFVFTDAFERVLKLEILLGQGLIILGLVLARSYPAAGGVIGLAILTLIGLIPLANRAVLDASLADRSSKNSLWLSVLIGGLGRQLRSANLIARRPDRGLPPDRPCLILMAHYDTKSQTLSLPARVLLLVAASAGATLCAISLLVSLVLSESYPFAVWTGTLALLAGLPLLLLQSQNASPGALDNAVGVGIITELAEVLTRHVEIHRKLKLVFVTTGAEEYALMGARAYLKRASNPFSPVRAGTGYFLLNFDGTGGDGTLNLVGRNRRNGSAGETGLGQLIKRCSDEQAIPLTRYNLPALLMDHMPFAQEGIDAVSLTSLGRSALSVHTSRDTIENLSAEQVQQAGVIAIRVIEKLADSL